MELRHAAGRVRRHLVFRSHVLGARALGRPRFTQDPILLMGTPRSGTSFVGAALGRAPEVAYLREPITDHMFHHLRDTPLINGLHEAPRPAPLVRLADRAFGGPLPVNPRVTKGARGTWSPSVTTRLVKEVQPLASAWLVDRYDARYLALLRHPGGIARSWWARGWGPAVHEPLFSERFREWGISEDPAERLGAVIGAHEEAMLDTVRSRPSAARLIYEDIAEDPPTTLHSTYARLGLSWTPAIAEHIAATTQGHEAGNTPANLVRRARQRAHAWREDLEPEVQHALRRGYERGGGTVYLQDW